jgi:hypothetical protein
MKNCGGGILLVMLVAFLAISTAGCEQYTYAQADRQHDVYLVAKDATILALEDGHGKISLGKLERVEQALPYLNAAAAALESTNEAEFKATVAGFLESEFQSTDSSLNAILARDAISALFRDVSFKDEGVFQSQTVADAKSVIGGVIDGIGIARQYADKKPAAGGTP